MSAPRPQQYRPPGPPPAQQPRHAPPQQQAPQQQAQQQPAPQQQPYQRPPEPPAPQTPVQHARGDGTAMTVLRVVTYVLTSLASLVFLIMVVYASVKFAQFQDAISTNPLFGGGGGFPSGLDVPTSGAPEICATAPDDPSCALY